MATNYERKIKTSIKYLDYNTACRLIRYVDECFASIGASEPTKLYIQFYKENTKVTADNLKDFEREAYRQKINVTNISIKNNLDKIKVYICYFNVPQKQKIIKFNISSENTTTLTDMMIGIERRLADNNELLRIQKRPKVKTAIIAQAKVSNTQIPQSTQSNITINVGGDFNMSGSAIGSNNKAENEGVITTTVEKNKDVKQEETSFWEGVWQQVVANGVWWILGVIGVSILAYMGLA